MYLNNKQRDALNALNLDALKTRRREKNDEMNAALAALRQLNQPAEEETTAGTYNCAQLSSLSVCLSVTCP